ncbi:MAG: hypothetical protein WD552_01560 [Candidatus Paceibacterota bacterium]
MIGTFIILIGPSGSGKNTLLQHVKQVFPQIHFPPSYSSRVMRPQEQEGDPYHFISPKKFKEMIEREAFLEWAEYSGNYYGTAKESIIPYLEKGEVVMKELEIQGVQLLKNNLPAENLHTIFIAAGGWDDLQKRILSRSEMSPEDLAKRHERFKKEMEFRSEADTVIKNEDGRLNEAKASIEEAIRGTLETT